MTDLPAPSSSACCAPAASGSTTAWLVPVLVGMAATMVSQGFARFTYAFVLPAMKPEQIDQAAQALYAALCEVLP